MKCTRFVSSREKIRCLANIEYQTLVQLSPPHHAEIKKRSEKNSSEFMEQFMSFQTLQKKFCPVSRNLNLKVERRGECPLSSPFP